MTTAPRGERSASVRDETSARNAATAPVSKVAPAGGGTGKNAAAEVLTLINGQLPSAADGAAATASRSPMMMLFLLLTVLSLVPSILMMTTCFVRFVIVFNLLKQALGTPSLPPTQVLTALAMFMTLFVMTPVWRESWDTGVRPWLNHERPADLQAGESVEMRCVINTFRPMKRFMSEQIHRSGGDDLVWMLIDFRRPDPVSLAGQAWSEPQTFDEVEAPIIVTAFLLSELKAAFLIGFQIYLPFLVIDMVVATVLTSMGMMMLPPTLVSIPFKILLFVLIDGWALTVQTLLQSVEPSFGW